MKLATFRGWVEQGGKKDKAVEQNRQDEGDILF